MPAFRKRKKIPSYRLTRDDERAYEERRVVRAAPRDNAYRPYVGVDVVGSKFKFGSLGTHVRVDLENEIEDQYTSFNLTAGMRFNRHFGAELFFQQSGEEKKNHDFGDFDTGYATKFNAYGIDFIGYLPVSQEVELLGALGFGNYNFDVEIKNDVQDSIRQFDTTAWRFGAGIQFNLNEHWGLRFMGRYVHMWDDYLMKNLLEASLGIRYMF